MTRLAPALLALSGCSFVLMEKPPDRVGDAYPECSESAAAPVADLAIATLTGLIAAGILAEMRDESNDDEVQAVAIFTELTALHVTSGIFGAKWKSECSTMRAEWQASQLRFNRPSDRRPTAAPPPMPPVRPRRGGAGEPCYPNATCNTGLTCDLPTKTCR